MYNSITQNIPAIKKKVNVFDHLLSFMIILLAAGDLGGFYQPIRIFIISLFPIFLFDVFSSRNKKSLPLRESPSYNYELLFFLIFWVHSIISLYWAIDIERSLKAFIHLSIYFLGIGEMFWFASKALSPQRAILRGWALMIAITLPVAFYELITDIHLFTSFQDSNLTMKFGSRTIEERRFSSVTFGNLNAYNVVLCMAFCMILIKLFHQQERKILSSLIMLLTLFVVIIINSSRGATICLVIGLIITFILKLKNAPKLAISFAGIFIAAISTLIYYFNFFSLIVMRFQSQGVEDNNRWKLVNYGVNELIDNYGLGVGIGNFIPIMMQKYQFWIAAPHNMLLEIGTEFGIFILLGFIGLFFRILKRAHKGSYKNLSAALVGISMLVPLSIIDSGYILKATTWIFISSLSILSTPQYNESE